MELFSGSADRNKEPILNVVSDVLMESKQVLEIGSGTGQHALFFAKNMPHLMWYPTDCGDYLQPLIEHMAVNSRDNIGTTIELDVRDLPWRLNHIKDAIDVIYTTNTLHIMGWEEVENFFTGVGQVLSTNGHLIVYGPFKYKGNYTTPSNADFDLWLKDRNKKSGIRDFEVVNGLANHIGLTLLADHSMPANNQCLIWQRE